MSESRDTATTAATTDHARGPLDGPGDVAAPRGLIVLGTAPGGSDADAGECADGFCAL